MVSKYYKIIFSLFAASTLLSCGGATITTIADGSAPIILSTSPLSSSRGSMVTITGTGFSIVPQENVIIVGGASVPATNYLASGTGESITFQLSDTTALGDQNLVVLVEGANGITSNQITLTITP